MKMELTYGELFAGVGMAGFGFERAGWEGKWFVEIEDYPHQIFKKNFPEMQGFKDVRECGKHNLPRVDVIFGGFPCQDLSVAGRQSGLSGERSGLFFEFARIVGELRPRWWIMENVTGLLTGSDGTWFTAVLSEVAALGYDATWHCIPACAVGAPHRRDRVWIVANASNFGFGESRYVSKRQRGAKVKRSDQTISHRESSVNAKAGKRCQDVGHAQSEQGQRQGQGRFQPESTQPGQDVADTDRAGLQGLGELRECSSELSTGAGRKDVPDARSKRHKRSGEYVDAEDPKENRKRQTGQPLDTDQTGQSERQPQPRLGRVVDGTPDWIHEPAGIPRLTQVKENRVNRLKALGNGLIWQIPYIIALGINELEENYYTKTN